MRRLTLCVFFNLGKQGYLASTCLNHTLFDPLYSPEKAPCIFLLNDENQKQTVDLYHPWIEHLTTDYQINYLFFIGSSFRILPVISSPSGYGSLPFQFIEISIGLSPSGYSFSGILVIQSSKLHRDLAVRYP